MKKNSFLGISLIALFLMVIGTEEVFCQVGKTDYYAVSKTTWAIPARIDKSELTNEDREELDEYEYEYDECDENTMLYLENFSWLLSLDKESLKIWMAAMFDEEDDVTMSERDGFVIATYEDEEDGFVMEMAINPNTLIYEERYFGAEDNPFFEETGNKSTGLYRVTFKKTTGVNQDIVPVKEINLSYDTLSSGIPYEVTDEFTYLYYKHINDYNRTITTGDVKLFNDCMGYDGIKEIQQANLKIYPNPAKEQITISLSAEGNENVDIRVFNMLGVNVLSQQAKGEQINIDVQSLPAGVYAVRCVKNDNVITKRFVKQ